MSILRPVLCLAAGPLLVLTACTVQTTGTAPTPTDGGAALSPTAPDGGGAKAGGLSCLQILQCIVECAETDAACPDACVERGTPEAQTNVTAFAGCIEAEKCTEASCVQEKCAKSLCACTASSAPRSGGGQPLPAAVPGGSVPAELVGVWSVTQWGATEELTFNSDGTGQWRSASRSGSRGCTSITNITRTGNVVIADALITFYASRVRATVQDCSPPALDTEQAPATEQIRWARVDANTIEIIDNTCAANYAGSESAISAYCKSALKRR